MLIRSKSVSLLTLALAGCTVTAPGSPPATLEAASADAEQITVRSPEAFAAAVEAATPGTEIILANGIWKDFDALFEARGTEARPIILRAETPGGVILSGQSSLRLAGKHLLVSGLVFRDGYTPRAEVISFRKNDDELAFNSRVTEVVIEDYSNPDRTQRDIWVMMYGQNNVFERSHLAGKTNSGPTMAVRLNSENSQDNNHVIRNNYFGPRPVFGSNGGETLRIGTSHYSLTRSGTLVENNYFDRCGGEVEIVSNKAGGNTFRGNTFFQSRGTLTLRHGNGTMVEGNLFDGNGAPYTGGVRVINADQTVRNNHFRNLTGQDFSGALVVMNGVPDSPINRYHQVDSALIENNEFDTVSRIELAEGSDAERTAVPVNSAFRNNIVIGAGPKSPFQIQDDLSGITFENNVATEPLPNEIANGFDTVSAETARSRLSDTASFGVAKDDTGVDWHEKPSMASPFEGGRRIDVAAGADALTAALSKVEAGDTLVLAPGEYHESRLANLQVPVTIEASDPQNPPLVRFERPNLFLLSSKGGLRMSGITVSGEASPDASGNSFISTTTTGGSGNHTVILSDMRFRDFDVNKGFSVVSAAKGTFYDRIAIESSQFTDISGAVVKLDAETDDYGIYSAEYLVIEDSRFENIGGPVAAVYRGGRDESTFGPHVWVRGSSFDGVGLRGGPLMELHGVQDLKITGNEIANAEPAIFTVTTGDPQPVVSDNSIAGDDAPEILKTVDMR